MIVGPRGGASTALPRHMWKNIEALHDRIPRSSIVELVPVWMLLETAMELAIKSGC